MAKQLYFRGTFSISDETGVPGYFQPNRRWNGFACPYFNREAVDQIIALSNAGNWSGSEGLLSHWDGDRVVIPSGYSDNSQDEEAWDVWDKADVQINGEDVWPLGAGSWVWTEAQDWEEVRDYGPAVEVELGEVLVIGSTEEESRLAATAMLQDRANAERKTVVVTIAGVGAHAVHPEASQTTDDVLPFLD